MKKITRLSLVGSAPSDAPTSGIQPQSNSTARSDTSKRRRSVPLNQLIRVRDDVDTLTLLTHASEILDSLTAISANFADEFDGSKRHVAVAMKQLSALAEILVCRARDNLDPQGAHTSSGPETRH
jgi:MoxR-like ATPase